MAPETEIAATRTDDPVATILCVTCGLPSVRYAAVELARRLAAAGHRVVFAGDAEARELVEHQRLEFLPLESSRYPAFLRADAGRAALARLLDLRRRRELATDALAVDGFVRAARELAPDLVLINGEMHEQIIAAAGAGLRLALLNSFVSIWRRPGLPPPHCPARPGVGWWGSAAGMRLLWLALRLRKRLRTGWQRLRHVGCDRLAILRSLARRVGFDLRRETDSGQWLIPFTYRRLPVLSLHALELELPHRPPERVRYVGPMVLEARVDRPMPAAEEARLEAVLARCRRAGGERWLVYAGFGSVFSADLGLLRRLAEAAVGRPDWELVISLSGRFSATDLGPLPDRVHVFSWLPQLEVLRHADVAVNHGGIGTIDECVQSGVPALVYCGGETDMAGTTARVVHHGIGIAGDPADDAAAIRRRIDRLLGEPGFRERVLGLKARYAAYDERRVAERAVEDLLAAAGRRSAADAGRGGGA